MSPSLRTFGCVAFWLKCWNRTAPTSLYLIAGLVLSLGVWVAQKGQGSVQYQGSVPAEVMLVHPVLSDPLQCKSAAQESADCRWLLRQSALVIAWTHFAAQDPVVQGRIRALRDQARQIAPKSTESLDEFSLRNDPIVAARLLQQLQANFSFDAPVQSSVHCPALYDVALVDAAPSGCTAPESIDANAASYRRIEAVAPHRVAPVLGPEYVVLFARATQRSGEWVCNDGRAMRASLRPCSSHNHLTGLSQQFDERRIDHFVRRHLGNIVWVVQ